jgi:hypothetical protein
VAEALGGHGLLVPAGDERALGAALGAALGGALEPQQAAARAAVAERFEARVLAATVSRLHFEALTRTGPVGAPGRVAAGP